MLAALDTNAPADQRDVTTNANRREGLRQGSSPTDLKHHIDALTISQRNLELRYELDGYAIQLRLLALQSWLIIFMLDAEARTIDYVRRFCFVCYAIGVL